jgi:CDP-glycerol glycerophosphotransferase (TagB/SpsB family)
MAKTEFDSYFNIDQNKPIILFTCNDSSSKNDPIYLDILCGFIVSEKISANLIVRTSPAESPERFKHLREKYPFIKWNYPEWNLARDLHPELWTQRIPTFRDINTLKHLLKYADLVINVLSTITLDASIFDKPVINPVFGNDDNKMFNDQKFLNYKHLKDMLDTNCSSVVKNEVEYLQAILTYLNNPELNQIGRKKLVELEVGVDLTKTSSKMVKTLKSLTT